MKLSSVNRNLFRLLWIVSAVAWTSVSLSEMFGAQQSAEKTASVASAPAAVQKEIKIFDTPQQGANALVDAAEKFDVAALEEILGPDGDDIVLSGEYSQDYLLASDFAAKAHQKKSVSVDPKIGTRAFLLVGDEDWPFPAPIVKRAGKWSFDAKAGRQELFIVVSAPMNWTQSLSAAVM